MIERRIDTDGHDRKFKVWVDWCPGGESILVSISPEYMSYSLSPVLSSVQNNLQQITNIHCQNPS